MWVFKVGTAARGRAFGGRDAGMVLRDRSLHERLTMAQLATRLQESGTEGNSSTPQEAYQAGNLPEGPLLPAIANITWH
jgi:hypothetical protein